MQYLLTKEELDAASAKISPAQRAEIAGEVLQRLSLEMGPLFTQANIARDRFGYDEHKDVFKVSLEAVRGAFARTRKEFGVK